MTFKPKSWRDVLPVHPAAEVLPPMSRDEQIALGEDIKANGLTSRIAIISTTDGCRLLDGRNRLDAMERAGIKFELSLRKNGKWKLEIDDVPIDFARTICAEPYAFVISSNIHRRHLTGEQKRDVIAKLMKATPAKSNRQIAAIVKADDKTVGSVRRKLEATAEIPQLTKTVGKDGKARKPPTHKPSTTTRRKDPAVIAAANRAEKRSKTKPAPCDPIAEQVLGTITTEEEERWHNSLGVCAGEAIALSAMWTREFGPRWKTFAVEPEHRTLARQAAQAWVAIAEQLEKHGKLEHNLDTPEFLRRQAP
jgi:hypothetical protein